eukprot:g2119.t1
MSMLQNDLESGSNENDNRYQDEVADSIVKKTQNGSEGIFTNVGLFVLGLIVLIVGLILFFNSGGFANIGETSVFALLLLSIVGLILLIGSSVRIVVDYRAGRYTNSTRINPEVGMTADEQVSYRMQMAEKRIEHTVHQEKNAADRSALNSGRKIESMIAAKEPAQLLFAHSRFQILFQLFEVYSKGSDSITAEGLINFAVDFMGLEGETSLSDAMKFMKEIDTDGDKLVQRGEFITFMVKKWRARSSIPEEVLSGDFLLKIYRKRGITTGTPLVCSTPDENSPSVCGGRGTIHEWKLSKTETEMYYLEVLKDMYMWYDKNNSNAIDCNGLIALVRDLIAIDPTLSETREYLAIIDDNGDMMVQEDEFLNFMTTQWKTSAPVAKQYTSLRQFLDKVNPILQQKTESRWRKRKGYADIKESAVISATEKGVYYGEDDEEREGEEAAAATTTTTTTTTTTAGQGEPEADVGVGAQGETEAETKAEEAEAEAEQNKSSEVQPAEDTNTEA